MEPENNFLCPQCGASMEQHLFVLFCPFCGFYHTREGRGITMPVTTSLINPATVYKNGLKNKQYISQCSVRVSYFSSSFIIESNTYFAPRCEIECHPTLRFWYHATCDNAHISLRLKTNTNAFEPVVFVKLDNNSVLKLKTVLDDDKWAFVMNVGFLSAICSSKTIQVECDQTDQFSNYDELIIYSQRFYNAFIDRTKYSYSQKRFLLCDTIK